MRQNILLRRHVTRSRVLLPKGTSFLSRYERVSRRNLKSSIAIIRTRTIGPRNRRTINTTKQLRFVIDTPGQKLLEE